MGGMLLVHGGKNTFQKFVLSEFNVYDFLEQDWVPVTVSYGKVNRYQQFTDDESSQVKNFKELGARFFHAMTVVYDRAFYENKSKQNSMIGNRSMWVTDREHGREEPNNYRTCTEGFYIFGGVDDQGVVHNDLWLARPNYSLNQKFIHKGTCEYIASP